MYYLFSYFLTLCNCWAREPSNLRISFYHTRLTRSLPCVTYIWHNDSFRPTSHMCDIVDYPYTYKLIINYLFITCWLSILSIGVDYSFMCFICVQVNMCDILRKRKACCMGHSEGFFNLTVVASVFLIKNFLYKNIFEYINIYQYI